MGVRRYLDVPRKGTCSVVLKEPEDYILTDQQLYDKYIKPTLPPPSPATFGDKLAVVLAIVVAVTMLYLIVWLSTRPVQPAKPEKESSWNVALFSEC